MRPAIIGAIAGGGALSTPLIVDSDYSSDFDDMAALWVAMQSHREGAVKLIGVMGSKGQDAQGPGLRASLDAYGLPDVPVGVWKGGTIMSAGYDATISAAMRPGETKANYPSAVDLYRQLLAAAAPGSVVIVSIGFLTNIADLLASAADGYSALNGVALVASRVKELVVMGGGYPSNPGEFNLAGHPVSASYVADNWPSASRLVWSGVGADIYTGPPLGNDKFGNAMLAGWQGGLGLDNNERSSWDPVAVHYACGIDRSAFTLTGVNGKNTINSSTGANSWSQTPNSNQDYVTVTAPQKAALRTQINAKIGSICASPPSLPAFTPSLYPVPNSTVAGTTIGTVASTSATGRSIAYTLTSDAGGRFALSGSTLVVGPSGLASATARCYGIVVRATDALGWYREREFVIELSGVTVTEQTETATFFAATAARGASAPTADRRALVDSVIAFLKGGGVSGANIFADLDGFFLVAAHDSLTGITNIAQREHDGVVVGSPTFTADRGSLGVGSGAHILFNNGSPNLFTMKMGQNDDHLGCYVRQFTSGRSGGLNNLPNGFAIGFANSTAGRFVNGPRDITGGHAAGYSVPCHVMQKRNSADYFETWADGAPRWRVALASQSKAGGMAIHRVQSTYSSTEVSAWHWGKYLSDSKAADMAAIVKWYLYSVGAAAAL